MITVRRERPGSSPGLTSAGSPCSSPSIQIHGDLRPLCAVPARLLLPACPSQPGCWLWFWVRKIRLLPPEWFLPVLTQILCSNNHS